MKRVKNLMAFLLMCVFTLSISFNAYASTKTYLINVTGNINSSITRWMTYTSDTFTPASNSINVTYRFKDLSTSGKTSKFSLQKRINGKWSTVKNYTVKSNSCFTLGTKVDVGVDYRIQISSYTGTNIQQIVLMVYEYID